MTMSQWKGLLKSSKKASSLPPTPAKAALFTAVCEKVKATKADCATRIPSHSSLGEHMYSSISVSTTRTELKLVAALKSNLTTADNYNKLSLSSGYTVPTDAERVIKQAAVD